MKQIEVFDTNYSSIKSALEALIGQKITVTEYKTMNKSILNRGVLTLVSDNLFCFDVPLGKTYIDSCSYTFYDLKTKKVVIKELDA